MKYWRTLIVYVIVFNVVQALCSTWLKFWSWRYWVLLLVLAVYGSVERWEFQYLAKKKLSDSKEANYDS